MKKFLAGLIAVLFVTGASCDFLTASPDFGDSFDAPTWQCLAKRAQGAILSLWASNQVDPTFATNLAGVQAAGIKVLEGYVGLVPNWNGTFSIDATISSLKTLISQTNMTITNIYLIVAEIQGAWYTDPQVNFDYLLNFTLSAQSAGLPVRIYSDQSTWANLFQGNWDDRLTNIPVWYYSADGQASFADWVSVGFGEFTTPALKFYQGDQDCGSKLVMLSWRPSQSITE